MFIGSPQKTIAFSVLLLIATGLVFIYSVSGPYGLEEKHSRWYYFFRQLIFAVIAIAVMIVCSRMDYRNLLRFSPALIVIALGMLVLVLNTKEKQEVRRWIDLGFVQFQPSEFFKVAAVMYLANLAAKVHLRRLEPKKLMFRAVLPAAGLVLIIKQPDLGTLAAVFIIIAAISFIGGLKLRYIAIVAAAVLVMGSLMVFGKGYEKDRLTDYAAILKDPLADHTGPGLSGGFYQVKQSLISIGSGGLFGRGLGEGSQKNLFLPAPHTDFIFASSAEEGGMLLCLFILGLYMMFFFGAIRVASLATDIEGLLLATGMAIMIVSQAAINIGVAVGLLPVTGITLPFFSYGGSSLVISCAAAGMILSVARHGCRPELNRARIL